MMRTTQILIPPYGGLKPPARANLIASLEIHWCDKNDAAYLWVGPWPIDGSRDARRVCARSAVPFRLLLGDEHGEDEQQAASDHLIEGRHARQDHPVVHDAEYDHSEHSAYHPALAARQRPAAHTRCGHPLQL